MSTAIVVSLRLQSGETFENIPVGNLEQTLGEFLNEALLTLENEAKLILPDTDHLINPEEFKVFDETHTNQLDLHQKLCEMDYITQQKGEPPILMLESSIFRSADMVHRDDYVRHVMKRGNTISGNRCGELIPPPPPVRSTSLSSKVVNTDTILYLAGRNHPPSSSSSSSSSSNRMFQVYSPLPLPLGGQVQDMSAISMVFSMAEGDNTSEANVSVATEDTVSISSSVSGSTEPSLFSEGRSTAARSSGRSLPRPQWMLGVGRTPAQDAPKVSQPGVEISPLVVSLDHAHQTTAPVSDHTPPVIDHTHTVSDHTLTVSDHTPPALSSSSTGTLMGSDVVIPPEPPRGADIAQASQSSDVAQASQSSDVAQAPQSSDVAQATQSSDIAQTPQSSDIAQAPQSSDGAQAPQSSDVAQAPQSSDFAQTSQSSDVAQTSQSSDIAQAPQNSDVAQAPQSSDVAQAPQSSDVAQAPQSSDIAQAPQSSDVAQAPQSSDIAQAPQSSDIAQAPQEQNLDDVQCPLGGEKGPRCMTSSVFTYVPEGPPSPLVQRLKEQSPEVVISSASPALKHRQPQSPDQEKVNNQTQSPEPVGVANPSAPPTSSARTLHGRRKERESLTIEIPSKGADEEAGEEAGLSVPLSPVSATPKHSPRLGQKWSSKKTKFASKRGSRMGTPTSDDMSEASQISRRRTILMHAPQQLAGKVYEIIKTFLVQFDVPGDEAGGHTMMIRGDFTVGQIKANLWMQLREEGRILEESNPLWDLEKYTFTYKLNEETFELYDEQQIFQTSTAIHMVLKEGDAIVLQVEPKKVESKEEKTLNMEISTMIGIGLYQLQFANNDELDITRRKMVAVRKEAVQSRKPLEYSMEQDLTLRGVPQHVRDQIDQQDGKILIRVYYTPQAYQTFQVEADSSANEVIRKVFPDKMVKRDRFAIPADAVPEDYVLKEAGHDSYIYGYHDLLEFEPILRCLNKKLDIELFLVRKLNTEQDRPRNIPDWNLIDPSTGLTGTHKDLSIMSKEHTQVFTMSLWDMQHKFRVRVVGLDNFKYEPVDNEVVYVEMGIYHGGHLLGSTCHTVEMAPTTYMRWNQWLVFDVQLKNLPKAARLCVCMYSGTRSKDTRRKSIRGTRKIRDEKKGEAIDRPLHWVNMQILDHRALLRQGLLRLNLWPVQADSENAFLGMDQRSVGSTAVNPDGNNSVALYIELDTYAHPVACPTGGWGKETTTEPQQAPNKGSAFHADLQSSIKADPLSPLTKAQSELLWKFREHCSTIPEALPKFLQCVDWASLEQVQEAHRLLKIWRPITMEVALELLDYHFADDQVRSLAVKRLKILSKDTLLSILLQMIQVLKFEPYHDSALARFLLRSALTSKKIGHYFYWYLRSEMDSPEFSQRFGILLEAYLRGCGEGVLKELQKQHTAVCNIMSVATTLKKYIDRTGSQKGVAEYAKEELQKYSLPDSFSPPYDPSVRMGQVNVSKSRVMDSKKTPLWLEFSNVDPTAINQPPIKIIAKNGDDLRQDMLTLQMLSLMDKLWQEQGLNLHIISYGCISTGSNMGIIEVVQEAETVAKIQKDHGGSFSVLKDDPLWKWLEKKNPTSNKMELAVQRFTLSCAGYCVATYILGIGDRHNDNIMVTTSGILFHIDFGHFLGNIKTFLGMNRERAPFVLTPDFEYVMGKRNSETFKIFEETAVKAYLIIRKNANLFINLFSMMKCTGIPELTSIKDLDYLKSVMVLDRSEEQAADHFRQQIQECLKKAWSTQINWLSHNFAHSHS